MGRKQNTRLKKNDARNTMHEDTTNESLPWIVLKSWIIKSSAVVFKTIESWTFFAKSNFTLQFQSTAHSREAPVQIFMPSSSSSLSKQNRTFL